jgi:hypothetical protein
MMTINRPAWCENGNTPGEPRLDDIKPPMFPHYQRPLALISGSTELAAESVTISAHQWSKMDWTNSGQNKKPRAARTRLELNESFRQLQVRVVDFHEHRSGSVAGARNLNGIGSGA